MDMSVDLASLLSANANGAAADYKAAAVTRGLRKGVGPVLSCG